MLPEPPWAKTTYQVISRARNYHNALVNETNLETFSNALKVCVNQHLLPVKQNILGLCMKTVPKVR